jgi:serine protease Do
MPMEENAQIHPDVHQPPQRRSAGNLPVLVGLLAGLVLLAALPYLAEQLQYGVTRGRARAEAEVAREELAGLPEAVNRFRLAVKAVEPSVVGIEVFRPVGGARLNDEWTGFFSPQPRYGMGQGSGVIVDKAGFVVTNSHVVNDARRITVRLSDGRSIEDVEVIGRDPASDLAVLRIRATGLVEVPWGDSDKLEVGDQVLAVGSPFRLAQTVTAGIISAKDRRGIIQDLDLQDFLQTDAAINPGNSGGPLVDLKGRIVGINTAIVGESYRGIGFAIPSKIAEDVYNRLKAGQTVPRGWLGVQMQDLNEGLAQQLNLSEIRGVLIADLVEGAPAEKAGLQKGDVIVEWNGKRVSDANDLVFLVAGTKVGTAVKVVIFRDGSKLEKSVNVGERPADLRRYPRR